MTRAVTDLPLLGHLPALNGATQWINTAPIKPEALQGKVVLISFWTYTCINWLRTLPYIRAWAEKYKKQGLIVIGVHTPEFSFEHNIDNVEEAMKSMGITYPVAIDNKYAIWSAFDNHYWPALYFVDASGRIRHTQFGEGEYEMSERVLQQLLSECVDANVKGDVVTPDAQGIEQAADWSDLESPETYLGYDRTVNFKSPTGIVLGKQHAYRDGTLLGLNEWALSGSWTINEEFVMLQEPRGIIAFCFHARDLNLVMGPPMRGASVQFRVQIDHEPPKSSHGEDIDTRGNGTAAEQRLYQLIRQPQPIADRLCEIEFYDAGAEAFVFTFG